MYDIDKALERHAERQQQAKLVGREISHEEAQKLLHPEPSPGQEAPLAPAESSVITPAPAKPKTKVKVAALVDKKVISIVIQPAHEEVYMSLANAREYHRILGNQIARLARALETKPDTSGLTFRKAVDDYDERLWDQYDAHHNDVDDDLPSHRALPSPTSNGACYGDYDDLPSYRVLPSPTPSSSIGVTNYAARTEYKPPPKCPTCDSTLWTKSRANGPDAVAEEPEDRADE
jgi:hypothetical protein